MSGIDVTGLLRKLTVRRTILLSSQLVSFDDDEPEKYLDIDERGKREY